MRRAGALVALAALVALLLAPSLARANALDTFGFGPRAAGMAGAGTAEARGQAAAFHNPANLTLSDDIEAAISYSYAATALKIDGRDANVTTPRGVSLGLSLPAHLGPITAAFGLALYLPDQFVARIQLVPATEPHFALLDNELQHVVVQPVVALRFGRAFAIGGGASVLTDAGGHGVTFDVGVNAGNKVGQAAIDLRLPVRAAPVLGVTILPKPWLRVSAAYRGELDLKLSLDILAHVDLPGAISGDTLISLVALNFYSPHTVTGAVAVDLGALTLTAQLDWLKWSSFTAALPTLNVNIGLAIAPPLVAPAFPVVRFDDQYIPRLGAELHRAVSAHLEMAARVGYAYMPSPVRPQTGLTSFADNDRHVVAVGVGFALRDLLHFLPKPLHLDAALQVQQLEPRAAAKDPHVTASPGFSSSGTMVLLTAGVEAHF